MSTRLSGDSPLRTVIVDDEPLARDCIRLALAEDARVEIVAECGDGEEALEAIRRLTPDLVFLDVQMPGYDGFEILNELGADTVPAVIFVTAFDQHALRAFDVHAIDYLVKPFEDERLRLAVSRAEHRLATETAGEFSARLAGLLREMNGRGASHLATSFDAEAELAGTPQRVSRFVVRKDDRAVIVKAADVDWFEASGNYVVLHVRGAEHRIRGTLRGVLDALDPRQFVRIHKSTVINVDRVKEVQPWFGGDHVAILHDGKKLRVSRTFAQALLRPMQ